MKIIMLSFLMLTQGWYWDISKCQAPQNCTKSAIIVEPPAGELSHAYVDIKYSGDFLVRLGTYLGEGTQRQQYMQVTTKNSQKWQKHVRATCPPEPGEREEKVCYKWEDSQKPATAPDLINKYRDHLEALAEKDNDFKLIFQRR